MDRKELAYRLEKIAFGVQDYHRDESGKIISHYMQTGSKSKSPGKGFTLSKDLGPDYRGRHSWVKQTEVKPGSTEYTSALKSVEKSEKRTAKRKLKKRIKGGLTGAVFGGAAGYGSASLGKLKSKASLVAGLAGAGAGALIGSRKK